MHVTLSHKVPIAGDRTQTSGKVAHSWDSPVLREERKGLGEWECAGWLAVVGVVWRPQSRAEAWQSRWRREGEVGLGRGQGRSEVAEGGRPSEPCERAWWGPHGLKAGGGGRCAGAAGEEEVGGGSHSEMLAGGQRAI